MSVTFLLGPATTSDGQRELEAQAYLLDTGSIYAALTDTTNGGDLVLDIYAADGTTAQITGMTVAGGFASGWRLSLSGGSVVTTANMDLSPPGYWILNNGYFYIRGYFGTSGSQNIQLNKMSVTSGETIELTRLAIGVDIACLGSL